MIVMSGDLEKLKKQEKKAAVMSSISLGGAMLTMALWGWTPLKNVIPAFWVLVVFGSFMVLALAAAIFRIYRGIQVRALKAKIADAD